MDLTTRIAVRFLTYSKWQSLFVALGVGVGVAVQIFIGILIDSLQANLIRQTVGSSTHIAITHSKQAEYLRVDPDLLNTLIAYPGVSKVAEVLDGNAITLVDDQSTPILFRGLDASGLSLYGLDQKIISGSYVLAPRQVLIGAKLAEDAKLSLGDRIALSDAKASSDNYKIVGIFETGVENIDKSWVIADLRTVQAFFDLRGKLSLIGLQLSDVFAAQDTSLTLKNQLNNPDYEIKNWQETNAQLLNALSSQSSSSFMIQFFVLMSVLIAIASVLSITVMQKSKQLGILKAMGLNNHNSTILFIKSSFILGALGSTLGVIIGFGLFFGFINGVRTPDGAPLFEPNIRWIFVFLTWVGTIVAATFAGYFPAKRSGRIDPIEIIQNE